MTLKAAVILDGGGHPLLCLVGRGLPSLTMWGQWKVSEVSLGETP